ncbi:hypothetical protein U1Q18_002950, partial [Sarracenia purpurea var. burkii]
MPKNNDDVKKPGTRENLDDEELKAAFEKWKYRTYALTVPLRVIALRGSLPPSWVKDFIQSQGRRAKLCSELRGSLDDIFSDLSTSFSKGNFEPKSVVRADVVTGPIEPLQSVEDQEWFKGLSDKWK